MCLNYVSVYNQILQRDLAGQFAKFSSLKKAFRKVESFPFTYYSDVSCQAGDAGLGVDNDGSGTYW